VTPSVNRVALGQGVFYLVTGIWPLLSIRSFEAITGPKTDRWLVKTAGVLIAAVGAGLTLAGGRGRVTPELATVAIGSAAGLTAIDLVYVGNGRISRVYLLDAVAEVGVIAAWGIAHAASGSASEPSDAPRGSGGRWRGTDPVPMSMGAFARSLVRR